MQALENLKLEKYFELKLIIVHIFHKRTALMPRTQNIQRIGKLFKMEFQNCFEIEVIHQVAVQSEVN